MPQSISCRNRLITSILAAAVVAAALPGAARALSVSSTTPTRYALHVPETLTQVSVTFDSAPTVPTSDMIRVSGNMSGLHPGTILVTGNTLTWTNGKPWMRGELVHVNLRSDITSISGPLTDGYVFAFTIRSGAGTAVWSAPEIYDSGNVPYFIYGGDLDGDGRPDVAAPCEQSGAVATHLNKEGTGYFPTFTLDDVGDVPSSIFGEDLDNDGDVDLATADIASGTVSVLLNHGDGTFAPKTTYSAGNVNTRQIHGGDFDGDNDVDLCATSFGTGVVYLFSNDGAGAFTSTTFSNLASGPFAIRTGDLNGDGRLDIGVACQNADSLTVMMNQGGGTFAATGRYRIGDGPWCLNGNDFDADGDFDLTSVSSFGNRIAFLENDGTGAYPTRQVLVTGAFPLGVFCADFDGDGDIDGTSSNFSGATVQTFLNDGTGTFALQTTLNVQASGSYTWAHDLDGDGDLDLSVVDENADLLFVFYNGAPPAVGVPAPIVESGAKIVVGPNPALAGRGITLRLSGGRAARHIDIMDIAGRRVRSLPGDAQDWDGRDDAGSLVPAGGYVVRAELDNEVVTKSIRVLR